MPAPRRCTFVLLSLLLLLPFAHTFFIPAGLPPYTSLRPGLVAAAAAAEEGSSSSSSSIAHHDAGMPRSTLGAGLSVAEALEMLLGLEQPSVSDYNLAIAACAREGQHEPACWLIGEEMAEWGLTPDRLSYTLAIEACAPAGMVEEARHLLSCMKDAGACVHMCASLWTWEKEKTEVDS